MLAISTADVDEVRWLSTADISLDEVRWLSTADINLLFNLI